MAEKDCHIWKVSELRCSSSDCRGDIVDGEQGDSVAFRSGLFDYGVRKYVG